ncbi:hypothetical protein SCB49_02289 [unidentified eubacterium SCB49]|nr:hypothetical protein SCB49_02289 [unidentified eubacterium SCB49]
MNLNAVFTAVINKKSKAKKARNAFIQQKYKERNITNRLFK